MIKKIMFSLLMIFLLTGVVFSLTTESALAQEENSQTVWQIIQDDESSSDFEAWVKAAGLVDNLQGDGPFTVFAPTNEAMAVFETEAANHAVTYTDMLLYHLVNGRYLAPHIANQSSLQTLFGERVGITVENGEIVLNDTTTITLTDVEAANGVVHIIDTILTPPENTLRFMDKDAVSENLAEVLAADGRFTTFLSLSEQVGLDDDLNNSYHNYTVFAPTDDAFAQMTDEQKEQWLTDQEDIDMLLSYHLVSDRLGINQIATDDYIPTNEGRPLFVSVDENSTVWLNGQPLQEFNITAANGVIHVVDAVLMP